MEPYERKLAQKSLIGTAAAHSYVGEERRERNVHLALFDAFKRINTAD